MIELELLKSDDSYSAAAKQRMEVNIENFIENPYGCWYIKYLYDTSIRRECYS